MIVSPSLEKERVDKVIEETKALIKKNKGLVKEVDLWTKRQLAYPIVGEKEGVYVVITYEGGNATNTELNRVLRINDQVLRHMISYLKEKVS